MLLEKAFESETPVINVFIGLKLVAAGQSINQNRFEVFVCKVGFQLRKDFSLFLDVVQTQH